MLAVAARNETDWILLTRFGALISIVQHSLNLRLCLAGRVLPAARRLATERARISYSSARLQSSRTQVVKFQQPAARRPKVERQHISASHLIYKYYPMRSSRISLAPFILASQVDGRAILQPRWPPTCDAPLAERRAPRATPAEAWLNSRDEHTHISCDRKARPARARAREIDK